LSKFFLEKTRQIKWNLHKDREITMRISNKHRSKKCCVIKRILTRVILKNDVLQMSSCKRRLTKIVLQKSI
jgi:hypothetical protein